MKKQWGKIATALFLLFAAFTPLSEASAAPKERLCQICHEHPARGGNTLCRGCCGLKSSESETSDGMHKEVHVNTKLVKVYKTLPSKVSIGEEIPIIIKVEACEDVGNIEIEDKFTDNATYLRSDPIAEIDGNKMVWKVDTMEKGEVITLLAWLRADVVGDFADCITVAAWPRECTGTIIGQAVLELSKSAPKTCQVGKIITYTVTIKNIGNVPAKNIEIVDTVPPGLEHKEGKETLTFNVDVLKPGACKTFRFDLIARGRGLICNPIVATATNAERALAKTCTDIIRQEVQLSKTGVTEQFICKPAEYLITMTNIGDNDLTEVILTDQFPKQARILRAEGANIKENTATWNIGTLHAGASMSRTLTMTIDTPATTTNRATVQTKEGINDHAEVTTTWQGHPALAIEMIDSNDPILIGDTTIYKIAIKNQGTASDKNVRIIVEFPPQVCPTRAAGVTKGSVSEQTITFAPYPSLGPDQSVQWHIEGKAIKTGDARIKVKLFSDLLQEPVTEEESTHVY